MKARIILSLLLAAFLGFGSCGSSQKASRNGAALQKELDDRNSAVIPLITRIRKLPGIALENGVPVFIKSQNTAQTGARNEPLYVVDGLIIGNSYRRVKDIVQAVDVADVDGLSGSEASFYGTRGANGVILITTKQGSQ